MIAGEWKISRSLYGGSLPMLRVLVEGEGGWLSPFPKFAKYMLGG